MEVYDLDSYRKKEERKRANTAISFIKQAMATASPLPYSQLKAKLDTRTVFPNNKQLKMFFLLLDQQYGKKVHLHQEEFYELYPTVDVLVNTLVSIILNKGQ